MAYWTVFILAVYSITQFFGGYKYFKAGEELQGYLMNGLWILIFVSSMLFLTYKIYSEERAKNNIKESFAPFELIYNWRGNK